MSATSTSSHALLHQFDTAEQQKDASTLGMWMFLVTEIMFFGGMFTAYIVYRTLHPEGFVEASHELDITMGAINTAVLICSSLTMVLAVYAAQTGARKGITAYLVLTILLGAVFLGIKAVEYHEKFVNHHVPGPSFHFDGPHAANAQLFFSLYFAMTGLHALHMIIGIVLLSILAIRALARRILSRLLHPCRHDRPLLALRRYRVDFPVPAALSARRALTRRPIMSQEHVTSRKVYFAVFAALLALTYATVVVSRIDLGELNTIAALSIAVAKALLVVLFFMHVRHSTRLTKLVVVGGFLWLALLIGFTMADEATRSWMARSLG